jgi:hypothetical protein
MQSKIQHAPIFCLERFFLFADDPQIGSVLLKIRRVHAVVQANGQRTISLESMLAVPGTNGQEANRLKREVLQKELDALFEAAADAVTGGHGLEPACHTDSDKSKAVVDVATKAGLFQARHILFYWLAAVLVGLLVVLVSWQRPLRAAPGERENVHGGEL